MTVYFHGSFGLNRKYMAGVLKSSLKHPKSSADEIAAPFGYKAPFTGRYRSWLHKTGLTTGSGKTGLTPFGQVVWKHDPDLRSLTTQWFMHHELNTDPERAEAWHYFANHFAKTHKTFSQSELEDGLAMKLMPHSAKHFGKGSNMIKVIARKIVQCYTQPDALGALGIVEEAGKTQFAAYGPKPLGPWATPNALEKAFATRR